LRSRKSFGGVLIDFCDRSNSNCLVVYVFVMSEAKASTRFLSMFSYNNMNYSLVLGYNTRCFGSITAVKISISRVYICMCFANSSALYIGGLSDQFRRFAFLFKQLFRYISKMAGKIRSRERKMLTEYIIYYTFYF